MFEDKFCTILKFTSFRMVNSYGRELGKCQRLVYIIQSTHCFIEQTYRLMIRFH
jgi:hypothetical protein